MTLDEAVKALNAMQEGDDEEAAHGEADKILCQYLRGCGAGALANAFETARDRVGFWYS